MDERLAELWGQGLSGGQIAQQFGTTRNAALGRLNRLGLLNISRTQRYRVLGRWQARREAKAMPKPLPLPEPVIAPTESLCAPVSLLEATSRQCRWIVQEVPPMVCGKAGRVWCPEHRAIVYTKHERKRGKGEKWAMPI